MYVPTKDHFASCFVQSGTTFTTRFPHFYYQMIKNMNVCLGTKTKYNFVVPCTVFAKLVTLQTIRLEKAFLNIEVSTSDYQSRNNDETTVNDFLGLVHRFQMKSNGNSTATLGCGRMLFALLMKNITQLGSATCKISSDDPSKTFIFTLFHRFNVH
ncbi:hypothetical protein EGR_09759 [Echinococcus granulosus]|uniref:Uncharacterized protein n=1 Tax=Echinococcus granulosus TaxID=6210 RepID=W6UA83_ECHGR|nr:hypothetical protein EGR_09759 [Echinococcus granulosus]EUB55382.1 hypothetical protein EGR_09759 [Echinococcus granulosus]